MSKILSLDGDWQMIWDTEDAGISNRWYATYPKDTQEVQVRISGKGHSKSF